MNELIRVLREVLGEKTCYSAAVSLLVKSRGGNPFSFLTGQEMEVLRLLVHGLFVEDIFVPTLIFLTSSPAQV